MTKRSAFLLTAIVLLAPVQADAQTDFWEPTGGPKKVDVRALAIKSRDTLFAATHRVILRSTDGGESWHEAGLSGTYAEVLEVSTRGEIFAAVNEPISGYTGVHRSRDGGITWDRVNSGLERVSVSSLASSPTGALFAGSWNGVFRSTDSGDHWGPVLAVHGHRVVVNGNGDVFVGTFGDADNDINRLYRSTDNGASWMTVQEKTTSFDGVACIVFNARGDVFVVWDRSGLFRSTDNGASWDSIDSSLTLSGGTLACLSGDTLFAATWGEGLMRSTDGGRHWSATSLKIHVWALAASSSGRLLAGGATLFRSSDGGESWSRADVGWTDFGVVLGCAGDDTLYAIGGGMFCRSTDSGSSWIQVRTPGIADLWVAPAGGIYARSNSGWGYENYRSTDGGEHWTTLRVKGGDGFRDIAFTRSGHIVAAMLGGGFYRSNDNGNSWDPLGAGLGARPLNSLIVAAGGALFAGSDTAGVFRSTDNGASWKPVNNGLPAYSGLPRTPSWKLGACANGEVFAAAAYEVFRSSDDGESWTSLCPLPHRVTGIIADAAGNVFAATEAGGTYGGVYRNGVECNSGLTDRQITCLRLNAQGILFVSTPAGIFRSVRPVTEGLQQSTSLAPAALVLEQNYPNPFNPSTTIRYALPYRSHVTLAVFSMLGQKVADLINGEIAAGYHEVQFSAGNLASGVYFYRMQTGAFVRTRSLCIVR